MISSTLSQLPRYAVLGKNFEKAIDYVLTTGFSGLEPGKYPIEGDDIFAIVNEYSTKPASECDAESHRDYADIQVMISGEERFGWTPLNGQPETTPYDPEKDVAFYSLPGEQLSYITLHPGEFIIFLPSDIHQPELYLDQPAPVKKAVIKVAL